MGFGTLFATVAFFVIMATGAFLFTSNIMYTAEVVSTSLDASSDLQNARLKTDIDIVNISNTSFIPGNATRGINVSIENTGSMKILNSDFEYMDVFIMCDLGERKRIRHTDNATPKNNEWTGEVNGSCDSINPGIFDPDEQMNIAIKVDPEMKASSSEGANWVKVVTSNGVSAYEYFNLSNGSVWRG